MANLQPQDLIAFGQDSLTASTTPTHRLGTRAEDDYGRVYRYALAGGADTVAGNVLQGPAITALHLANTPPAVAIGATSFTYTPGSTLGTLNQYEKGLLQVDTTPGNGYAYGIDSNPAFASATAFTLNLASDEPIQVALTTSSRVGLLANIYRGVIQCPATTATGLVAGVSGYIIPTLQWGWIQTWGPASVLIAGTPALGAMVLAPGATAGAAEIMTTTNLIVAQLLGNMLQVGVSGKNNFVYLKIRG
ncbi:MAG TPA: hypothetical protein VK467_04145 [Gemmatimonadales bacterium]|nr:hypothetical protein [Gemmatimonadales bacterium]